MQSFPGESRTSNENPASWVLAVSFWKQYQILHLLTSTPLPVRFHHPAPWHTSLKALTVDLMENLYLNTPFLHWCFALY